MLLLGSTVPSRAFCFNFPLPASPEVAIDDLPVIADPTHFTRNAGLSTEELTLRRGFDRNEVERCKTIIELGEGPAPEDRNVEISRAIVIGPPATMKGDASAQGRSSKHSKQSPSSIHPGVNGTAAEQSSNRGTHEPSSESRGTRDLGAVLRSSSPQYRQGTSHVASSLDTEAAASENPRPSEGRGEGGQISGRRGRRLAANAWSRITGFANAMLEAGMDSFSEEEKLERQKQESQRTPHASYVFAGEDGNGVDLTKGRVRMMISLPLITSKDNPDRQLQAPALMADFEGPFARVRHKLKVKLGFGFGDKPLGEGEWGQALVMCVPVSRGGSAAVLHFG